MSKRNTCRITALCLIVTTLLIVPYVKFDKQKKLLTALSPTEILLTKEPLVFENDVRPLVVIGILSENQNRERRDALRRTWIRTINNIATTLPFRTVYKFYLYHNTLDTDEENKENGDLTYLNVTDLRHSKNVYIMYKHIYMNFPHLKLVIRLDDDVFLCVPQVFQRLHNVIDTNLYYGKKLIPNDVIDESFVVLGNHVIKWIAEQTLCMSKTCSNDMLMEIDDNLFFQNLLKSFKNIQIISDNEKINHIDIPAESNEWVRYVDPDFCKSHIAFYKIKKAQFMNVMHKNNENLNGNRFKDSSVSGQTFSGIRSRVVPTTTAVSDLPIALPIKNKYKCEQWAVVTTVFEPSKAIKDIAGLHEWCLLIVADLRTPSEKQFYSLLGTTQNERIKFLSIDEQLKLYPLLSDSLPFNSFARKNIGYIYAIHQKAKLIWDFDDDNVGIISKSGYSNIIEYLTACNTKSKINIMNPYLYSVDNGTQAWPRGFPLNLLKNRDTIPNLCVKTSSIRVGVIQSLANGEADVDAIYRLTHYPFNFTTKSDSDKLLVLPKNTYTPFNAQATLWFPEAFKYLALPISVTGRVTDIWRSYIAEYFFNIKNLQLAFSPPYVYHNRSKHNLLGDFHAETPLYEQSGKLIELLLSNNHNDLINLYDELYRRQYIEEEDLIFIRAWNTTYYFVTK